MGAIKSYRRSMQRRRTQREPLASSHPEAPDATVAPATTSSSVSDPPWASRDSTYSPEPGEEDVVTVQTEHRIALPSVLAETRLSIRQVDWNRIKRITSKIQTQPPRTSHVYAILFSVSVSSGFAASQMIGVQDLPSWLVPGYVSVSALTFVFGWVFVWLDKKIRTHTKSELHDLLHDMQEIESMFPADKEP